MATIVELIVLSLPKITKFVPVKNITVRYAFFCCAFPLSLLNHTRQGHYPTCACPAGVK